MAQSSAPSGPGATSRVGIQEVAKHAGVAVSSVSRVISGHPDVSARMRARVAAAIEELGYQPDYLAQSMRTGSTKTVGYVISDIRNPLFAEIAHGAELRLRASGYSLILTSSQDDTEEEAAHLRRLLKRRVDGLLVSIADESNTDTAELLRSAPGPVVLVDRDVPDLADGMAVNFDQTGFEDAVRHLIGLGHTHIGLVNGALRVRPSRERQAALERVVAEYADVRASIRSGSFTTGHGETATRELMKLSDRPTALIAGSNLILSGMMATLAELDIRIPTDVSLVTCDDVPMAAFLEPRLATIRRDLAEAGRLGAELLLDRLAGEPARTVTLPTTFHPASSCARPPGG